MGVAQLKNQLAVQEAALGSRFIDDNEDVKDMLAPVVNVETQSFVRISVPGTEVQP